MSALFEGRHISVYYNHSAEQLSIREIDPSTGEPGAHISTTPKIALRNAWFTSREDQWKKVQEGDLSISKQTGEIKGTIIEDQGRPENAQRVFYNPSKRHDFHLEDGTRVYSAEAVYVEGTEIYAVDPQ